MKFGLAVALAALLITGCAKKNDTPEAVREGIIRDVGKRMDISNMDVNVDSVSFRDKEADATVRYTIKGGSADQGMTMKYVMERHDDGQWYIKSRASNEAVDPTGGAGAMSGTGMGGMNPDGNLPAGHPPIGQH